MSTNYYMVPGADGGWLLFDAGWPLALHGFAAAMKEAGRRFREVRWAMVSHLHIDHAGLVRDFQDAGIRCILFDNQGDAAMDAMEELIGRKYRGYAPIARGRFDRVETKDSRAFLAGMGIAGEVLPTVGHSPDSVSLVLDSGEACIGDLCPLAQAAYDDAPTRDSWELLRQAGARTIYPAHAEPFGV